MPANKTSAMHPVIPVLSIVENINREETLPNELKCVDENGSEIALLIFHQVMAASSFSLHGWEPRRKLLICRTGHMSR